MMISDGIGLDEVILDEIEFDDDIGASKPHKYIRVDTPSSPYHKCWENEIFGFLKSSCSRLFSVFWREVEEREEISVSVPSRVHIRLIKKINLVSLVNTFKEWIKHPMNAAFLLWLTCVVISATMLGLLLLGLLNAAFPTKISRSRWIEIDNQVLNALFTLMSLYQHPNLFHHLVLLFRWRSEDIIELRKVYSKNGAYHPREWSHMMLVVLLLQITCFCQYVSCGLYWGYSSNRRPEFATDFIFALGTIAPMVAGLYTICSPLGRDVSSDAEQEEELQEIKISNGADAAGGSQWDGGLFDCGNDAGTCFLASFCTFCVFGWNMERLGFGNMYVHTATFFLLCAAPLWIFGISATNIADEVVREIVGISGLVLSVLGLIYGGFWRIKMRRRFGLSGGGWCCGSDSMTDYVQWVFCWACSLAQEVRTANFHGAGEGSFRGKNLYGGGEHSTFLERDGDERLDSIVVTMAPMHLCVESECTDCDENLAAGPLPSHLTQTACTLADSNQNEETSL